jgi:hypothetical protein
MKTRLEALGHLPWLVVVATIAGVAAFGFAQPLLDLLGRNPEFFIARRFPALDIGTLAMALLVTPAVLTIPVLLLRLIGPIPSAIAHLVLLAAGGAVVAASVLVTTGLDAWPTTLFFTLAAMAGLGLAWLYLRFGGVRTALAYLGLAPAVFALWFALATPTSQVLFSSPSELPEAGTVGNPVPVVMIVFDEFPLASMIHPDGSLDAEHYPNFARLAGDGVWYRNAVGVRQQTEEALPAILTGVAVSEGSIPTTADHPFNLFTLLSDGYEVAAVENVTELCPSFVCSNESRPIDPISVRWRSVLDDLAVVYGHLTLPDDLADRLPAIDQGWGGFDQQTAEQFDIIERFLDRVSDDRRLEVDRFLETFERRGEDPPLRFGHFLYPHHPWDLTADGRVHGAPRPPGRFEVGWGPDPFLVAQGWQRHLIQAQWTDVMVGRVVDRLVTDDLYDDALVIVVADHGITIHPNTEHQRVITSETIGSVAVVPLFVKYPEGMDGVPLPGTIDDDRAETTDLLPTIADVVDVNVPWRVDGVSLLDDSVRAARQSSVMLGSQGEVEIPPDGAAVRGVAAEKEGWFPRGDPYLLTPPGWSSLLDQHVGGDDVADVSLVFGQAAQIAAYVPGSDPIPSYLSGTVGIEGEVTGEEIVAVAVDGVVEAVTRPYELVGSEGRWEAMLDPVLLDAGGAEVQAWLVRGSADSPRFVR